MEECVDKCPHCDELREFSARETQRKIKAWNERDELKAEAEKLASTMELLTKGNWPSGKQSCAGSEIAQTMLEGNCELAAKSLASWSAFKAKDGV